MSGPPPDLDDLRHQRETRRAIEGAHLAARRETWLLIGLAVIFGIIAYLFLGGFLGAIFDAFEELAQRIAAR